MKWSKVKIFRIVWLTSGICFYIWMYISMSPHDIEKNVFTDSSKVQVTQNEDYLSFTPVEDFNQVIFFYPGALVDPDAYAPLCRRIAENGFQVHLINMPWRMATLGYKKIMEMNMLEDDTKQYILIGHSQGGKMAAQFVYENPNMIDKLILLGTTHPRDNDMSSMKIPVLKIYGSNDGIAEPEKVNANKQMLPATAKYIYLEGANHSQFGYYGYQLGDSEASISREKQQEYILEHILNFIQ